MPSRDAAVILRTFLRLALICLLGAEGGKDFELTS